MKILNFSRLFGYSGHSGLRRVAEAVQPTLWVGWRGLDYRPPTGLRPMSRAYNLKPLRGMAGVAERWKNKKNLGGGNIIGVDLGKSGIIFAVSIRAQ